LTTYLWNRTVNGVLDIQNWTTTPFLINQVSVDAALYGGATFRRLLSWPVFSCNVLATTQPVTDYISKAMVFYSANFDLTGGAYFADPNSDDPTLVEVELLKPTVTRNPTGTNAYQVQWLPERSTLESHAQRRADLTQGSLMTINGGFTVIDATGAIANALNKNIFTSGQVAMAGLFSHT